MTRIRGLGALAIVVLVAALLAGCTGGGGSYGSGAVKSAVTGAVASDPAALGKAIFTTGQGHAGAIPRSMNGAAYDTQGMPCAGCHGPQGQGTGLAPSITRATLGASHSITHKPSPANPNPQPVTEGPWTTDQTVSVVQTGKTPEGNQLGGRMPMWKLDSQDAAALAAYLGTL